MAEPRTVVDDARNLIQGNPMEWAAYKLGYQAGVAVVFGDDHNKLGALALAYLAIAAQDPHPDAYTLDEMDALDAAGIRVLGALQAFRHAHKPGERRHEYDHHRGYAAEHHYDVEPVCTTCHMRRGIERGEHKRGK